MVPPIFSFRQAEGLVRPVTGASGAAYSSWVRPISLAIGGSARGWYSPGASAGPLSTLPLAEGRTSLSPYTRVLVPVFAVVLKRW